LAEKQIRPVDQGLQQVALGANGMLPDSEVSTPGNGERRLSTLEIFLENPFRVGEKREGFWFQV